MNTREIMCCYCSTRGDRNQIIIVFGTVKLSKNIQFNHRLLSIMIVERFVKRECSLSNHSGP